MPCSDLFIYFTLTIGVKMGNKIGVRWTIVVALAFKYISYLLLYFVPNYYVVLVAMCLFGVGSGLGNLTYMKNSWKYFPKSQGLVNGIILGGAGLSSSVLTPLADYWIINPERTGTDKDGIYPETIANRLTNYLIILCVLFLILGTISVLLSFQYEEGIESIEEPIKEETPTQRPSTPLLETFFSVKNLMMLCFCFCGFCKHK